MLDSPLVVLQVLPALVTGGVERGTVEITQAITRAGGVALVASAGGPMVTQVERAGGRHFTLPLKTRSPFGLWRNAAQLAAVIRAENVALVHARSRAPAWSAWFACQRTGTPLVTTYHGAYNEDLPLKRLWNSVMARGEVVIAASRFIADLIVEQHGIDPSRIRVIPRGVDPAVFDPAAITADRMDRLRRDWRLPHGKPVVMLPGRLTSWKGQGVLLEAVARMRERDISCVLVGSDQGRAGYSARLARQADTLGIAARVRMVGQCDDMPAALRLADVVVHASTRPEAFGRVVVEAQAMARLVIASDVGGPVETVEHGVTGWRVPPDNPDALAAALEHALALSPTERQDFGLRARASVPTTERMQALTLGVYHEVLAQHGRFFVPGALHDG